MTTRTTTTTTGRWSTQARPEPVSESRRSASRLARIGPVLLLLAALGLAAASVSDGRRAAALESARALLDRADRADPTSGRAEILREARTALDLALGIGAPSPDGLYLAALARSLDANDSPTSRAEAEAILRRALARNPYHARAHLLLGRTLAEEGPARTSEAEHEVRTAHRISPQHRVILEAVGSYAIYRALETNETRYVDWALEAFRAWNRLEPAAVTRSLPLLRLFLERTEDLARAVPDELHPRLEFASVLMGMGRHEDAMGEYRRADVLDPAAGNEHEGRGLAQWGRLLVWHGRFTEGASKLVDAQRILGPAFADDLELARALLRSGFIEAAQPAFERALKKGGRSEEPIALLLEDIRAVRAFDAGCGWIAAAFPGAAAEPWRAYLRGRLLLLSGKPAAAKEEFLRSLRGEKGPRAYAQLARLSIDLGDFEEASAYAERALLYDPSNAGYLDLLEESRQHCLAQARGES